uniref:Uncharacterized protein n=1 Tax=Anguilla anguilla TaxID=7936 RepID=A0A0E9SJM2_ANGAN
MPFSLMRAISIN